MRLAICLLLAGCYAPNPPSGAYRCSTADNACPRGQHCVCDLCVDRDQDAACGFAVETASNTSVGEHESFSVTVRALQKDGSLAAGFHNTVTLGFVLPDGSEWCDVTPSTVKLDKGVQQVTVKLNRETIPPQRPKLRAVFAGNRGDSAGIEVKAPKFERDATAIVPPVSPSQAFGWADVFVTQPALLHDANGFRMYFSGYSLSRDVSIGVATSTDGKTFTARPDPVWRPKAGTWYNGAVQGPAPFFTKNGTSLAFTGHEQMLDLQPLGQIGIATSSDGLGPFAIANAGNPVLRRKTLTQMSDCDYCSASIDFASVLDEPIGESGLGGKVMYFSAYDEGKIPAIGRATSSDDGMTWVPEPAPVLSGDFGGEGVLMAPHVLVDGTVFKMWYSFASLGDLLLSGGVLGCDTALHIGYATSKDGFYWVRSPSNVRNPAVSKTPIGWDMGVTGFIAGSAIATDGSDPANGISLYYTTLRYLIDGNGMAHCVANGIGRSTRL